MKFCALIFLTATAIFITKPSFASQLNAAPPVISQLVITQYTGSDKSNADADPIYRIWLQADGTAVYVGNRIYMKRIGRYHGKVEPGDFLRLTNLFQQGSFLGWRDSYNKYDDRKIASEKFSIIYGARQKTVIDYESSGPKAVRRASKIAYGLLWKIRWHKVSDSDSLSP